MFRELMRSAFFLLLLLSVCWFGQGFQKKPQWTAPASADEANNPFKNDAAATALGKNLFTQYCESCHGAKGKGDGIAGIALNPPPGNLVSQKVQAQTDGAIYWKITEGNPPMASYKTTLTNDQRWQLVNYIRELGSNNSKKKP